MVHYRILVTSPKSREIYLREALTFINKHKYLFIWMVKSLFLSRPRPTGRCYFSYWPHSSLSIAYVHEKSVGWSVAMLLLRLRI